MGKSQVSIKKECLCLCHHGAPYKVNGNVTIDQMYGAKGNRCVFKSVNIGHLGEIVRAICLRLQAIGGKIASI